MWKRFFDNVFFIWTDSEKNLEKRLKELNSFHPNIKFTFEKSKMKVNSLDVVTEIKNGRLSTDFRSKLAVISAFTTILVTNNICKIIIIYSQTLSLRKICSDRKDLKSYVEDLKGWLLRWLSSTSSQRASG